MPAHKNKAKQKAKENGLKFYFTGVPCIKGHLSDRFISNGECIECYRLRYPGAFTGRTQKGTKRDFNSPRQLAIKEGKKTYLTGKPCKRGHISDRFVSTFTCVECSRIDLYQTERDRYRSAENTLNYQFRTRINNAKRNGLEVNLDFDKLDQPEFCPVLGIKLNYGWSGENKRDPAKATLDRIDSTKGYTTDNTRIISWRANRLKNNMTIDELEKILQYIKENKK